MKNFNLSQLNLGLSSSKTFANYDAGIIIGGLAAIILLCVASGFSSGGSNFFHIPSLLLVLGGTIAATVMQFPWSEVVQASKSMLSTLQKTEYNPVARIRYFVKLSQIVKTKGILFLEEESRYQNDNFLRKGFLLVADNSPADLIHRVLETEHKSILDHTNRSIQVIECMGAYSPALGLIGTLIGLIQMLSSLKDPAVVGPAMALALVTTFYGAILANLVFIPIAGKLRGHMEKSFLMRQLAIEGILGLSRLDNSLVVEQKLMSYLPTYYGEQPSLGIKRPETRMANE